jgi:AcrR family transcriptional regulator
MTYAKSRETINNILEAARSLFVERNYFQVTIADISAKANISTGAPYHHFSSKEDIYLQMMHYYLEEIREILLAATDDSTSSSRDRLRQSSLAFLKLPDELLGVLRLVRRDINLFEDPMRRELIRAYQMTIPEPIEAILRDGIASGEFKPIDARVLSWQLVALVEVSIAPYSRRAFGKPEEISDLVLDVFLDGIARRNQTERMELHSAAQ